MRKILEGIVGYIGEVFERHIHNWVAVHPVKNQGLFCEFVKRAHPLAFVATKKMLTDGTVELLRDVPPLFNCEVGDALVRIE